MVAKNYNASEYRTGIIEEVNQSTRKIILRDVYNGLIQIQNTLLDPLTVIPKTGESWQVCRIGQDWYLDRRIDDGTEIVSYNSLTAGDRRIEGETLYLDGKTNIKIQVGSASLYFKDGALIFKGGNGTVTTIGPA